MRSNVLQNVPQVDAAPGSATSATLTRRSFLTALGLGGILAGCMAKTTLPEHLLHTLAAPAGHPAARRVSLQHLEHTVTAAAVPEPVPLGLTDIHGFEWDEQQTDVWLMGTLDAAAPPILVDHFVGALRATQTAQAPGMTLLPVDRTNPRSMHQVLVFPEHLGLADSRYMAALIQSDYLVKALAVAAATPPFGLDDVVTRYRRAITGCGASAASAPSIIRARVWFVPVRPVLRTERLDGRRRVWIDQAEVMLAAEEDLVSSKDGTVHHATNSPLQAFAREFTARFQESKRLRVFWELHTMYKLGLLAELLHQLELPPHRDFWLRTYPLQPYATPRELPGFTPHTVKHTCWGQPYEYSGTQTVVQIWGGVLVAYKGYLTGQQPDSPFDLPEALAASVAGLSSSMHTMPLGSPTLSTPGLFSRPTPTPPPLRMPELTPYTTSPLAPYSPFSPWEPFRPPLLPPPFRPF
jgi:hypothetical protein